MLKKIFISFLPFLVVFSCASKDEKLQNYKEYVKKIANEIKYEDGFNTIKVFGERRSIFRSYFIKNELVFIKEDLNIGNRGRASNMYYFKNDDLVYFEEKSIILKDDSLKINSKSSITSTLFLDGKDVLESERFITAVPTPFSDEEVESIINHSQILNNLAKKNRPKE